MVAAPEARARRLFLASFAGLWICAIVPLWAPRFRALLDMSSQLEAIVIWHRYHDRSWGYQKFYDLNLIPLPYWGYFFPVHLLSYVFPIEVANKIYLSAYAALLPLSVAALAERMGRNRWLALFSFPLVFNMNFSYGFITFCIGLVVLNFAIVVLDRFLEAPTRRRGVALALLTPGLYTTHVLPWMLLLLGGRHEDESAAPGRQAYGYRLEILVLLAMLAYLILPVHLLKPVDLWMIGGRFMTVIALFGALLPTGKIIGWRR